MVRSLHRILLSFLKFKLASSLVVLTRFVFLFLSYNTCLYTYKFKKSYLNQLKISIPNIWWGNSRLNGRSFTSKNFYQFLRTLLWSVLETWRGCKKYFLLHWKQFRASCPSLTREDFNKFFPRHFFTFIFVEDNYFRSQHILLINFLIYILKIDNGSFRCYSP